MNTREILEKVQFFKDYISPEGRAEIAGIIQEFREDYGAKWLEELKGSFPEEVTQIIELVANHDAQTAFDKFKDGISQQITNYYAEERAQLRKNEYGKRAKLAILEESAKTISLGAAEKFKGQLFDFHAFLRAEIDKPRFNFKKENLLNG